MVHILAKRLDHLREVCAVSSVEGECATFDRTRDEFLRSGPSLRI